MAPNNSISTIAYMLEPGLEKDRLEYQEYLDHLVTKGYILPEIEDLDLEKMQGVEGLKSTRITVT